VILILCVGCITIADARLATKEIPASSLKGDAACAWSAYSAYVRKQSAMQTVLLFGSNRFPPGKTILHHRIFQFNLTTLVVALSLLCFE